MDDLDLFAVENPRDGKVGYCTVLDGATIRSLDLKFRGRNAWPHFLS